MEKIKILVNGYTAELACPVTVTSGTVGRKVEFEFSEEWEEFEEIIATVKGSHRHLDAFIEDGEIVLPWECVKEPGTVLLIGVTGALPDGTKVSPTVYANVGMVKLGAKQSDFLSEDPSRTLLQQLEERIDAKYTKPETGIPKSDLAEGVKESLEKADTALQETDLDHTRLTGRNADNQHPISAITGLSGRLEDAEESIETLEETVILHTQTLDAQGETLAEHAETLTEHTGEIADLQRPATSERIGLVKPGTGIEIDSAGAISADKSTFLIEFTDDPEGHLVADKTLAEVKEAYDAGMVIMAKHDSTAFARFLYLTFDSFDGYPENIYLEFSGSSYYEGTAGITPGTDVVSWDVTDGVTEINSTPTMLITDGNKSRYGLLKVGENINVTDGVISVDTDVIATKSDINTAIGGAIDDSY